MAEGHVRQHRREGPEFGQRLVRQPETGDDTNDDLNHPGAVAEHAQRVRHGPLRSLFPVWSPPQAFLSAPLPFGEDVTPVRNHEHVGAGDGGGGDCRLVQHIAAHLRVGTETPAGTVRGGLGADLQAAEGANRRSVHSRQPPGMAAAREDHGVVILTRARPGV